MGSFNRTLLGIVGLLLLASVLGACGTQSEATTPGTTRLPSITPDNLATLIAMQQQATEVPSATPWPTPTPTMAPSMTATATPTATVTEAPSATVALDTAPSQTPTTPPSGAADGEPQATVTPEPSSDPSSPTPYPTNTPRSTQVLLTPLVPTEVAGALFDQTGEPRDHYWLARAFPRDPSNKIHDYASRSYAYGTTGGGQFATHHGIDIQNTLGTGILAAGSGWVVYAGDDSEAQFGPQTDFYGNLVIIEHDVPAPDGRPLYTLYGHLFRVEVETGQRVELQQRIGQVGATGVALGSHLHLEVRIGDPYDYYSTYNPDLWVRPWPRYGTLAGRVIDRDGNLRYNTMISIQPKGSGTSRSTYSYADDTVNPDPYYGENYTYADLPAGEYQVFVRMNGVLRFKQDVMVEAGKTSWLLIQLN